jgi:hypothetical protein
MGNREETAEHEKEQRGEKKVLWSIYYILYSRQPTRSKTITDMELVLYLYREICADNEATQQ